jgi:hypothetical protein
VSWAVRDSREELDAAAARDHRPAGSVGGSRLGMDVEWNMRRHPPLRCFCGQRPLRVNCCVLIVQVPRLHRQAQPKIQTKHDEQTDDRRQTTDDSAAVRCGSLDSGPMSASPAPAALEPRLVTADVTRPVIPRIWYCMCEGHSEDYNMLLISK